MERTNRYRATALRKAIEAQGRRMEWVADRAGIHKSLLSHVIAGRRTLSEPTALEIATTLGVDISMIFELSDDSVLTSSPIQEAVA